MGAMLPAWTRLPPTKDGNALTAENPRKPGPERKTPNRFCTCSDCPSCRSRTPSGKKVSWRIARVAASARKSEEYEPASGERAVAANSSLSEADRSRPVKATGSAAAQTHASASKGTRRGFLKGRTSSFPATCNVRHPDAQRYSEKGTPS